MSPKSFSQNDFTAFFDKADESGDAITGWAEIEGFGNEQGVPFVVAGLAKQYNYEPIILVGLKNAKDASDKELLLSFLKKNKINYLGLGVEVNRYSDYDSYAAVYNEIYDSVKEASPKTQVFPIFQYEQMKGLQGGLFGKENNPNNAEWVLIDKLKLDMIGFTTYPGLIYKNPGEIPSDYYLEIKNHVNKPVVFTEIGWFRSFDKVSEWESSEKEQADFIVKYFDLTKDLDVKLNIWSFLYDPDGEGLEFKETFNTMGLLAKDDSDGTSLVFEAWKKGN